MHGKITDAELDFIFTLIDNHLHRGQFSEIDTMLAQILVETQATDKLLTILTATLPAKDKLKNRKSFFKKVEKELEYRNGGWQGNILYGLE